MRFQTILCVVVLVTGCQSGGSLYNPEADEALTVGTVQREIRLGMYSTEVAEVLGSPNIVSTDEMRHETWIYDKISTQVAAKQGSAGVWVLIPGGSAGALGGASSSSQSKVKSQRTLTIIIKFDGDSRVKDFSYHSSRF